MKVYTGNQIEKETLEKGTEIAKAIYEHCRNSYWVIEYEENISQDVKDYALRQYQKAQIAFLTAQEKLVCFYRRTSVNF